MSHQLSDPWLMAGEEELPIKQSDNLNDMKFSDNFEPKSEPKPNDNRAEPLADSQQYIQSLEKKLEKLKGKGKTKDISSKHVMNSLSAKREAILQQLLDSNNSDNIEIDIQTNNVINNSNVYQYLERRLFPQMQALTEEELQRLLEADVLQKINKNETEGGDQHSSDKK